MTSTADISNSPTETINIPAVYAHSEILTDVSWVADHINDPTVRIVDARNPLEGVLYETGHIPGAVFVNVFSDVCCPSEIMSAEFFVSNGSLRDWRRYNGYHL